MTSVPFHPRCLALLVALLAPIAEAQIPSAFQPVVVSGSQSAATRNFDLTAAIALARAENKLLFVYLGAHDCPFCKQYERFLRRNEDLLLPIYKRHVVVDIRTSLRSPEPVFQVGTRTYSFGEFQDLVGYRGRRKPAYPYFWLLTPDLRAKAIPEGTQFFRDLQTHKRFLGA